MIQFVPGSERFNSRPVPHDELVAALPESLQIHSVTDEQVEALDPLTYEVVRHRMSSLTNEMGQALKRMSGSQIVTDANDFDFAVSDELGEEVQVGLYNTLLVGAVDLAISWTLRNRAANPGIEDGDMFLCNDPWVGGGLHQSDVIVFQPIFHDGKLFGWTSAVAHEADLGGPGLGSFNANAKDVFDESLPTPPVKIVRKFELQEDVADLWVRRSRLPLMVGLDLRAKIGSNRVGRARLLELIEQYGPDTVKAVMKRMMNDAERRLREKLTSAPDGTWRATGHQDSSGIGDRGIHSITLSMTKKGDHLTFDFTGTAPQHGIANCTYAGMRGGVMTALLPILANDIPWSAGGLMRCFDLISDEGTVNNATFPAALCRAPIGPAWMTGTLVSQCLAQMLDTSPETIASVQAACCGTWDNAVIGGLDERGDQPLPFLTLVMESMSGGFGAQAERDGVDTGGLFCVPMGRVPDVEMTELLNPLLALWRREMPDSGGPGRYRGGVAASLALTPYRSTVPMSATLAAGGKGVSQNTGLTGGYPGNTGYEAIIRGSEVAELMKNGVMPSSVDELGGDVEVQPCYIETDLSPGDVLVMHWQSGGGYGDPILREPEAVQHDVLAEKVSRQAAFDVYGVHFDDEGSVDTEGTSARRQVLRGQRKKRSSSPEYETGRILDTTSAQRLNGALVAVEEDGDVHIACGNCGQWLGTPGGGRSLALARYDGPATDAGPHIMSDPTLYTDVDVVFRQHCCPRCWTAIDSTVVPADAPDLIADPDRFGSVVPTVLSRVSGMTDE